MTLPSHRQHKIYLAATMEYGLDSDDPEEIAYYNKLKAEINSDWDLSKKTRHLEGTTI